jgi:D-alanyl-lipoteichoic acid acyltransferase DltB (MBOAT superfamily)
MLLGFELTLFLYVMVASLFWVLRPFSVKVALLVLIGCNIALLLAANPILTLYLAAQTGLVLLLFQLCNGMKGSGRDRLPWLAFLGLFPMNLQIWSGAKTRVPGQFSAWEGFGFDTVFWSVGASFFVIKSFVVLKEALQERRFRLLESLAALTFLPAFPAGPIFGTKPFRPENILERLPAKAVLRSIMQIGWGTAAFYVIAPKLRKMAGKMSDEFLGQIGEMYLNFAALFFDFSGYTILAIALGTLFGVTLPQNFNRPYLATSIREFWQRWHMSLSWFISTYLFKPFVRKTGSPRQGIFLAFVCVGLWHKVTLGYLLWGIGHGAALSLAMKPPALWIAAKERMPTAVAATGWFLTMTWVALLSYSANTLL